MITVEDINHKNQSDEKIEEDIAKQLESSKSQSLSSSMLSDEIKLINKPGTLDQSQSPSNVVSSKSGEADSGFRPVGVRIAINQMNSPKVVIEETVVEEHKDSNDYLRVKQFKNESAHIKNDKKSKSKDSKKQNSTFSNYTSSGFKFNQSFKSNSNLSQKARSI